MYTLLFDEKFKADLKKLDKSMRENELQVLVLTVDHRRKAYENI